jgi:3'-5' exoribonuclease
MSRRFVEQLTDGENLHETYLVSDKQLRANRNAVLFLQLELRDRTGAISARLWNATENQFRTFEEGDLLRIKGKVQLFQGSLQIILTHFDRVDPATTSLDDFMPRSEHDVGKLFERLRTILLKMDNFHLRALIECFFMDEEFVNAFCKVPAGVRNHHAYLGGLLEHVTTLLDGADRLLPLYPDLDRDLVLMGIFLHDIGKVQELSWLRSFSYTDEGQLLGHISIGVEMLSEKAAKVPELTGEPFPRELLLRLKHLILSHHGSYEFGSPRLPMTPEAIAVNCLDNFDAKVHSFTRDINDDRNGSSAWTPYSHATQRRLFKGSTSDSDGLAPADE